MLPCWPRSWAVRWCPRWGEWAWVGTNSGSFWPGKARARLRRPPLRIDYGSMEESIDELERRLEGLADGTLDRWMAVKLMEGDPGVRATVASLHPEPEACLGPRGRSAQGLPPGPGNARGPVHRRPSLRPGRVHRRGLRQRPPGGRAHPLGQGGPPRLSPVLGLSPPVRGHVSHVLFVHRMGLRVDQLQLAGPGLVPESYRRAAARRGLHHRSPVALPAALAHGQHQCPAQLHPHLPHPVRLHRLPGGPGLHAAHGVPAGRLFSPLRPARPVHAAPRPGRGGLRGRLCRARSHRLPGRA